VAVRAEKGQAPLALTLLAGKMTRWTRLDKTTTMIAMLLVLGIALLQSPTRAVAAVSGGYEMRVHLDRSLSISSSCAGDRFIVTVADPGPFNLARISGHVQFITRSLTFSGVTEMHLSFERIRFSDGESYPVNAQIIRLYDVPTAEQVDAEELIETHGHRRPQMLKRTGIGALIDGLFGVTSDTGIDAVAIRPRVVAAKTIATSVRKEVVADQDVEMLLRVYPN
jgi:hypothetical protein